LQVLKQSPKVYEIPLPLGVDVVQLQVLTVWLKSLGDGLDGELNLFLVL